MEPQPNYDAYAAHRGGLAAAIRRGAFAREEWTRDGTLLSAPEFAARRRLTPMELVALEARGELFSVEVDDARWYPAELLRIGAGDAAALTAALAGLEPTAKLVFLLRRHGAFGGATVVTMLANSGINRVLALAAAWRAEGLLER
jgi:hypothetical protein